MSSLPEGRGIRNLRSALVALAEQARALDLESLEELTPAQLADEPCAQVAALVEATMAQLDRLAEVVLPTDVGADHEQALSQQSSSFFAEIRRVKGEQGYLQVEQISDLAYLAAMELHQRLGELKSLDARRDRWHLLGSLGSSAGHVIKVVSIVEAALAMLEGEPGRLDTADHLDRSLETRRLYARFRHALQDEAATETDETLGQRLQRAASAIAQLVGRSLYPHLRINDRMHMRRLQERVIAWLRGDGESDRLGGERLWRDLIGFADLIMAVNRRHELEVHDRRLLYRLRRDLAASAATSLSTDQLANLRRLFGRSDDVDRLLRDREPHGLTPGLVIPWIDRLLLELGESHHMVLAGILDLDSTEVPGK